MQCTSRAAVAAAAQGRPCTGSGQESAQGAAHEENKRENPQQVVHRIVHAALGEQCEDGRSVRDEDRRGIRDVKHIRLRRGAPAWKSSRPRKSANREGSTRNAESECQRDSENLHDRTAEASRAIKAQPRPELKVTPGKLINAPRRRRTPNCIKRNFALHHQLPDGELTKQIGQSTQQNACPHPFVCL